MHRYTELLEPDKTYHVYNHAVGKINLFTKKENYLFFLKKYNEHISPIADTFAYCLMPNHFHLALRIKPEKQIRLLQKFEDFIEKNKIEEHKFERFISKQFSNLFSSYAQSFNKQENRKGSLFERPFKRLHIDSLEYFVKIIHYIHYNPVHHEFIHDFRKWYYSSFQSLISEKPTKLNRSEVLEIFDGKENFIAFHNKEIDNNLTNIMEG